MVARSTDAKNPLNLAGLRLAGGVDRLVLTTKFEAEAGTKMLQTGWGNSGRHSETHSETVPDDVVGKPSCGWTAMSASHEARKETEGGEIPTEAMLAVFDGEGEVPIPSSQDPVLCKAGRATDTVEHETHPLSAWRWVWSSARLDAQQEPSTTINEATMPSPGPPRSTAYIKRGAGGIKMAVKMAMVLLASCASPASANEVTVVIDPPTSGEEAGPPPPDGMYPRILTVLTTYNERTPYIKAYREAIETRTDGYEPVIFVTSDEEDVDPDGVIDYKFGEPAKHRLLRALTEAYARYEGQYDWVAVGDDDTVFMYNRARAFLKDIDHTQPVAIGRVDGIRPTGRPGRDLHCYSPEQKANTSDALAPRSCCKDFTRPCEVPIAGDHLQILDYGPGGLFWPYGGTGVFLSAGVMERVADGRGVEGWTNCSVEFDHGSTDCQLGICMSGRGLSFSSYSNGFFESDTADPSELQDYLASHCQVLGIHLGLRHLADGTEYTPQKFRDAAAAVRDEDERCKEADFEKEMCPEALAALSVWK